MVIKTIKDFPRYEVSDQGEVWRKACKAYDGSNLKRKQLKASKGKNGYPMVYLCNGMGQRRKFYLHRLVYETFIGEIPPKYEIDHTDGDRENNCASNLRAVTHKENCNNPKSIERYKEANSLEKGKFNREKMQAAKSKKNKERLKQEYIIIWTQEGCVGVWRLMKQAHCGYKTALKVISEMQGKVKNMSVPLN